MLLRLKPEHLGHHFPNITYTCISGIGCVNGVNVCEWLKPLVKLVYEHDLCLFVKALGVVRSPRKVRLCFNVTFSMLASRWQTSFHTDGYQTTEWMREVNDPFFILERRINNNAVLLTVFLLFFVVLSWCSQSGWWTSHQSWTLIGWWWSVLWESDLWSLPPR